MTYPVIATAVALSATLPVGAIGWMVGRIAQRVTNSPGLRSAAWSGAMGLTLTSAGAVPLLRSTEIVAKTPSANGVPYTLHLHAAAPSWTFPVGPLAELLAGAIALGATVSLSILAVRLIRLNGLRRRALPASPALAGLVDERCPIGVSAEATTAMLTGLRRPMIILPRTLVEALPPEDLRWICAHELAHLTRRDHLWALFDRLVGALLWFNPPLAAILRRRAEVRETVCDALALSGADPSQRRRYAETLVLALRLSSGVDTPQPAFIRRKGNGHVMRLKSILNPATKASRTAIALTAGMVAAGALSAAAVSAALAQQLAPLDKVPSSNGGRHSFITITSDSAVQSGGKNIQQGKSIRSEGGTFVYRGKPTIELSRDAGDFLVKVNGQVKSQGFDVETIPHGTIERIEVAAKGSPEAKAQGGAPNQSVVNIITKSQPRVRVDGKQPPTGFNPNTMPLGQLDHAVVKFTPGDNPKIASVDFITKPH